jgi:hypothetical protein
MDTVGELPVYSAGEVFSSMTNEKLQMENEK